MKWLAVCLLAAGCGGSASNPCNGQPGLCLAVEVRGNVPKLDVLNLSVTILPGRTLNGQATILPTEISLPVQFAALLPADVSVASLQIEVVGIRAGVPLAYGVATASVPPSGQRVKIELLVLPPDGGTVDLSRFPVGSTDFAVPFGQDLSVPQPSKDLAVGPCVPTTCNLLGAFCGTPSDGCGKNLSCGPACQLGGFTSAGTLNPGLTAFGIAQTNKFVYLFGGQDASQATVATVYRAPINSDGTLGAFTNAGISLTSARIAVAATVVDGFVYVTGGSTVDPTFGLTTPSTVVERAPINPDGSLGSFSNAGVSLLTARDSHLAVQVKNFFYVIGGQDATPTALSSIERAPVMAGGTLGAFSSGGTLTLPRVGASAVVTSSFVYVVSGGDSGNAIYNSIERAGYDSTGLLSGFSDAGISVQTARYGASATLVGNDVYLVGGENIPSDAGPGNFLTTVEHATVSGGTLQSFGTLSGIVLGTGRDGHGAAISGNSLYIIGGFDGTAALNSIERALLQ